MCRRSEHLHQSVASVGGGSCHTRQDLLVTPDKKMLRCYLSRVVYHEEPTYTKIASSKGTWSNSPLFRIFHLRETPQQVTTVQGNGPEYLEPLKHSGVAGQATHARPHQSTRGHRITRPYFRILVYFSSYTSIEILCL